MIQRVLLKHFMGIYCMVWLIASIKDVNVLAIVISSVLLFILSRIKYEQ